MRSGITTVNVTALLIAFMTASRAAAPLEGPAAARSVPESITNVFVLRRWEWIPAFASARLLPVRFPPENPARSVHDVKWLNDRWWIVADARAGQKTNDLGMHLWGYSPAQNRIERVRGVLDAYPPHALWPLGKELWVALPEGVAALHTGSLTAEGFNSYQGLFRDPVVQFAESDGLLVALGQHGSVSTLAVTGTNWISAGPPAPGRVARRQDSWTGIAGSRGNVAAIQPDGIAIRPLQSAGWTWAGERLDAGSPRLETNVLHAVEGDGEGGFWIGSEAGLHRLSSVEVDDRNQFTVPGTTIFALPPVANRTWYRHSAESIQFARERAAIGIRTRMRDRARYARAHLATGRSFDPVTPISRVPGPVRCVYRDGPWLWVATREVADSQRSRILLMHVPSEKWFGWLPVSVPVLCLAANERWLAIGVDASMTTAGEPFLLLEKAPLFATPANRRVPTSLASGELVEKLASLPVKERAVYAFFSRDARSVVDLLTPGLDRLDAESLFMLAFANDATGLDRPSDQQKYLELLQERHPGSVFAEIVRPASPADSPTPSVTPPPGAAAAAPTDIPSSDTAPPPAATAIKASDALSPAEFTRRDLNKDRRINLIELRLWQGPEATVETFDQDGDKLISLEELNSRLNLLRNAP